MEIEKTIFKRAKVDYQKLVAYGFKLIDERYQYTKEIMPSFKAIIIVDKEGEVIGKVIDMDIDDEYINYRMKNKGSFAYSVYQAYESLLIEIKKACFDESLFIYPQTNRIAKRIKERYLDDPAFIWDSTPGFGLYRHSLTNKWYGLIMNIAYQKLDSSKSGEVEVINVKLGKELVSKLVNTKGIYPAYHMNKQNWVSIIFDNSLDDDTLMEYIHISYQYSEK